MTNKKIIIALIVLLVSFILITSCGPQEEIQNDKGVDKLSVGKNKMAVSEKIFYKKSDLGTKVFKLTSDAGNDHIFYQNPNYFNPESSLFLFKSDRGDGKYRLYLLNVNSGEITLLRRSDSFGHIPTWSIDGKEIYIGERGKIIALDIKTRKERIIALPEPSWITFLDTNPAGDKILFVEEAVEEHLGISIININGSHYQRLFSLNNTLEDIPFYVDHPLFIDNNNILFLTRGEKRDFTGDYNKPYILDLRGGLRRLPRECSHYDVNPDGNTILCGSEGYIIDLEGNILKSFPEIKGHGVWSIDGDTFLMTGDPVPVLSGPYFGKIVIMKLSSHDSSPLVSHESTYNSSLTAHIQPNAQFSRDGNFIIYESDSGLGSNSDLYLVETNFNTSGSLESLTGAIPHLRLGNLCSGEEECISFCQNNRGRCEDYCKGNTENELCIIIFPPEEEKETRKNPRFFASQKSMISVKTEKLPEMRPVLKNFGLDIQPWDKKTNRAGDFVFENKNYVDHKIFTEFGHRIVNDLGEKLLPEIGFNVPVDTLVASPIDGIVTNVKLYAPSQDYLISLKTDEASPWIVGFEHVYNVRINVGDKVFVGQELAQVSPSYGRPEFGNVEINVWMGGKHIIKNCPFEFLDESLKPMYEEKINKLASDWEEFINKDVYKQEEWVAPGCLFHNITEK